MSARFNAALGAAFLMVCLTARAAAQEPAKPSPDLAMLTAGNGEFGLALYRQLASKDGNLFLSPYSISSALGMTYAGARGKTAQEMKATLRFSLDSDQLHSAFASLNQSLTGNPKRAMQLRVANRLWGQKDYGFLPEFLKTAETCYRAGLGELDFVQNPDASRKEINTWVEKHTQEKIKDLLPDGIITSNTRMVLTNAIYFKAAWMSQFDPKLTKEGDFTLPDGKKAKVPLMHQKLRANFAQENGFAVLAFPYEGNEASMILLLPKNADGLPAVEKELSEPNLKKWLGTASTHEVTLTLPKFKVTAQFMLNEALVAMGMREAFDPLKADFSGTATREKLFISAAVHKAFVEVNEEGTEAAAATAVIEEARSLPPPAIFNADHPFLFLIRDNATGSILFAGRLTNP